MALDETARGVPVAERAGHAVRASTTLRLRAVARRAWFWVRRYGPAEVGGTALLLAAAAPLQAGGAPVAVVTVVAVVAESLGFYGVMAVSVHRELRRAMPRRSRRAILSRSAALLTAEFGPAEVLDTVLIRPALVAVALLVVDGAGALLVGKVAADVAFYVLAAVAFSLTRRLGWRSGHADD